MEASILLPTVSLCCAGTPNARLTTIKRHAASRILAVGSLLLSGHLSGSHYAFASCPDHQEALPLNPTVKGG